MVTPFELAPGVELGGSAFPFIAGPCVIESEEQVVAVAREMAAIARRLATPAVFKASYDKANRTSIDSYRGPGLEDGLKVLQVAREETGLPVLTDVHEARDCDAVAQVCDVLQVPAFLCRQTDLVVAAACTGRPVLIKKGQFMAPLDMARVVEKVRSQGNDRVAVTERGVSFGYRNLVVDMRGFTLLHEEGIPVLYDVTHSLQLPGAEGTESGGDRRFAEPLARAATAAGADGLYLEVHPNPDAARCDRATQLAPRRAESLLASTLELRRVVATSSDIAATA